MSSSLLGVGNFLKACSSYDFLFFSLGALEKSFRYGDDLTDGFLRQGLFKYSRHPNFFAEFSMYVRYLLFDISLTYI